MTSAEIWNYLVNHYKNNQNANEKEIQSAWESFLSDAELFKYSKVKGDIDSQRSITIGSSERVIPDIIARKDNRDIFVIELKRYCYSYSKDFENQLFSYLKLLEVPIGILVCNKIYLYVYDFGKNKQENKLEIPFEKDNKDGIAFVELLSKDTFSKEKIIDFISCKRLFDQSVKEIQNKIDNEFVYNSVVRCLSDDYSIEQIEAALKGYKFSMSTVNSHTEIKNDVNKMIDPQKINSSKVQTTLHTYGESYNLNFWTKFNDYAFNNPEFNSAFKIRKPTVRHWYDFSIGSTKCNAAATHLKDHLGMEIYIANDKELFEHFFSHKNDIEAIVGKQLEWKRLPDKKASRVLLTAYQFDMSDESNYEKQFDWIIKYALKFKNAFSKYC